METGLVQAQGVRLLGGAVGGPVADDRAEAVPLVVRPGVAPGAGAAEVTLEQLAQRVQCGRGEQRHQEALDLSHSAGGAAVLLLVDDPRRRLDQREQPAAAAGAVEVEEDDASKAHGRSLPGGRPRAQRDSPQGERATDGPSEIGSCPVRRSR
nr:hypothetical protein [Kitasatospora griseola]